MRKMPDYQKVLARQLRQRQTRTEQILWQQLRGNNLAGAKFRRQRPLGRYIADFCCDEAHLVLEIDGGIHSLPDQQAYDKIRDDVLSAHGYTLLHITTDEIETDLTRVLLRIEQALKPSNQESPPLPPNEVREFRERGI